MLTAFIVVFSIWATWKIAYHFGYDEGWEDAQKDHLQKEA